MTQNNYNIALELLGNYKHELRSQIDKQIVERKEFIDSLTHEATLSDTQDYDMELVRLEDALYELDIFLTNFA